jgi:hypothetical protein
MQVSATFAANAVRAGVGPFRELDHRQSVSRTTCLGVEQWLSHNTFVARVVDVADLSPLPECLPSNTNSCQALR